MKYIAPSSSLVPFPTASIQLVWLVRPNPVKSAVHKFVASQGPAAPTDALRDVGNARSSPGIPSYPQSVGSPVPTTFVIPAARISSASIPASNHVRSGMFVTIVPPNADKAAFITVASVAVQRHVRHALSHVLGRALISRVRFHADRYVYHTEYTSLAGC
jgi:hypothetical protein